MEGIQEIISYQFRFWNKRMLLEFIWAYAISCTRGLLVNLKQNCIHHLFFLWVATWVWYLCMVFCSSLKSVLGQCLKWLLPQHVIVIFIYPLLSNHCLNMVCTYVVARCFSLLQAQTTQRNVMYSAGALFFGKFWVARNLLMILGAQHFALCGLSTQGNDHP